MSQTKRITAWILGLVMLAACGAAAGEGALPEIPAFRGTLDVRYISTEEEAIAYAKEIWALDYLGLDLSGAEFQVDDWGDSLWHVLAHSGDGYLEMGFDREGGLVSLDNIECGWSDAAPALEAGELDPAAQRDDDEAVAWRHELDGQLMYPFLKAVNPLVCDEYTVLHTAKGTNDNLLTHYNGTAREARAGGDAAFELYYSESYRDAKYRVKIGVQTEPVVRIVYFDVFCDANEGGNG